MIVDTPRRLRLYCKTCDSQHPFTLVGRTYYTDRVEVNMPDSLLSTLTGCQSKVDIMTVMIQYSHQKFAGVEEVVLPRHVDTFSGTW